MVARENTGSRADGGPDDSFRINAPQISLPRGGGAVRGMGEKFSANPVTGTGSLTVPIATSPGRAGFGPQLALSYDSGAGNGPFGFGWSLALPQITRKTEKGLPQYRDREESDVFILSGAEDLVPVYRKIAAAPDQPEQWALDGAGNHIVHEDDRVVDRRTYRVRRYQPRVEGLFARIERWTNSEDASESFWRSISRDNVTTWYGKSGDSRLYDPADPKRIFSWLICESHDDKGNVIAYEYKREDAYQVDVAQANERHRSRQPTSRTANRYLKHIYYGNHTPYLPKLLEDREWPSPPAGQWHFQVVFDYGDHSELTPLPEEPALGWSVRSDPFSSYRPGFEVRTYRLCQRVLMFHHFAGEADVGLNCLVRSTDFTFSSEQNPTEIRNPVYSFLRSVRHLGYRREGGGYVSRALPPVEFEYTQPTIDETIREVDPESLENLPSGIANGPYQWIDLDGEGVSGVLTEQAGSWFYKRNLSPLQADRSRVAFAPLELVSARPNAQLAQGAQFMDLAGDGETDLVLLDGTPPGFYEHSGNSKWKNFRAFAATLNRSTRDPHVRFVDLDGDGHADILITEDTAFTWHPSLAENGFGPARRVFMPRDEEEFPALLFGAGPQSIYTADMSGDGLTDIVRIRNGEVCYWPNLGGGRFGARVTMDNAPCFEAPDHFDQRRLLVADIDGTGTADIIYLHPDGVRLYFNQSGNSWSGARTLTAFPRVDDVSAVVGLDLLGNGTACLVWSSELPTNASRSMRYLDLMGGQKPHLLIRTRNNLGATTEVAYASSTRFYLRDRAAGTPWLTRLPFPVHVVERVRVTDRWRGTTFTTRYSYHHGYFDGVEREFRGFGRVEQVDAEHFGEFQAGNAASPYITSDHALYQPPVKTVTWFHTGVLLDRSRILSQFKDEYFKSAFPECDLPEPDLATQELSAEEWREALRACKGMPLRQESYELDVEALARGQELAIKLFRAASHNCHIRRLQPMGHNRHAVFLVTESEAITYQYEFALHPTTTPDPRITHTFNLRVDRFGHALQTISLAYPRAGRYIDSTLPAGAEELIARVQSEPHLTYGESVYTETVDTADDYRVCLPCEKRTFALTGVTPSISDHVLTPEPGDNRYYTMAELRRLRLGAIYQPVGIAHSDMIEVTSIPYQRMPTGSTPQLRPVEHVRTLYFNAELTGPLGLGSMNRLGIPYETYRLALTGSLLNDVFGEKLDAAGADSAFARAQLDDPVISGYVAGTRFDPAATSEYWIGSGVAGYQADAAQHFYMPELYKDAFGNITTLQFDTTYQLFLESSTDALGNTNAVTLFDFRVLAPREMKDANDNYSRVAFDALGLPVALAVMGKERSESGDNLRGLRSDLTITEIATFFRTAYAETAPRNWLANATVRYVYSFGEALKDGTISFGQHPAAACAIARESHVNQLAGGSVPIQVGVEYSDGLGSVLLKKTQAEPNPDLLRTNPNAPLRWIASGKTIVNNKGRPVKQYEPYFSSFAHRFNAREAERDVGVTPILYYDAPGRLVRVEAADGSYSRVEFSPWHNAFFDANDTVGETLNGWFAAHIAVTASAEEQRAARLALVHHDTPLVTILDAQGREVIAIAQNRVDDGAGGLRNEKYLTYTKLDVEGKPLSIRDARGNLVMQYVSPARPTRFDDPANGPDPEALLPDTVTGYDIAGNLLREHSMDAGERWLLNDALGNPLLAWDNRGNTMLSAYDALRRPARLELKNADHDDWIVVGLTQYGEGIADDRARNTRGQPYRTFDQSGLVTSESFDYQGNALRMSRQFAVSYDQDSDWRGILALPREEDPPTGLRPERFTQIAEYDALNRLTRQYYWHRAGQPVAVHEPHYNRRGLLETEDLTAGADKTETGHTGGTTTRVIRAISYNEKGQRLRSTFGNGVVTDHTYDPKTFRLSTLVSTRPGNGNVETLQDLRHTYDPSGNVTEVFDAAVPTEYFDNAVIEPRKRYIYDALYRLIEATGREHKGQLNHAAQDNWNDCPFRVDYGAHNSKAWRNYTQRYRYDNVGNILMMRHIAASDSANSWTRQYEYALDSNRLLATGMGDAPASRYTATPTLGCQYAYNAHGSMESLPHLPTVEWDYTEQLRHISRAAGSQGIDPDGCPDTSMEAWYRYDAAKQRTRKRVHKQGGLVEERFYLGGLEWYRRTRNGVLVEEIETLHVFDGQQRLLQVDQILRTDRPELGVRNLYRYVLRDQLGSVSLEMNDSAEIISYEEYHPFGTTAYQSGSKTAEVKLKRYRYTGLERDEESGLNYHGARYMATWLGRWSAVDPLMLRQPLNNLNGYHYANNNPNTFLDPSGNDIVVRPESKLTARQLVELIQKSEQLPPAVRRAFSVKKAHKGEKEPSIIVVSQRPKLNAGETLPEWFTSIQRASAQNEWEVTTGTTQVLGKGSTIKADIKPEQHPGYFDSTRTRWIPEDTISTNEVSAGTTIPSAEWQFEFAAQDRERLKPYGHRFIQVRAARGLVVVSVKGQERERSRSYSDALIARTLIHELAVHAGRMSGQIPGEGIEGNTQVRRPALHGDPLVDVWALDIDGPFQKAKTPVYAEEPAPAPATVLPAGSEQPTFFNRRPRIGPPE